MIKQLSSPLSSSFNKLCGVRNYFEVILTGENATLDLMNKSKSGGKK